MFAALAAGAMMMFASCEKTPIVPSEDDDDTTAVSQSPEFRILVDTVDAVLEGADVQVAYELLNPAEDGTFEFTSPDWVSAFNYSDSEYFVFTVDANETRERSGEVVVKYSYDGGSRTIEQSFVIAQDGSEFDVFLNAKLAEGEYYYNCWSEGDYSPDHYYLTISDLGIWAMNGVNFTFTIVAPAPSQADIDNNTILVPEGTYPLDTTGATPPLNNTLIDNPNIPGWTNNYYGIYVGNYSYDPWIGFCGGTLTVIQISETEWRMEASMVDEEGTTYGVLFEGVPEPLIYIHDR